MGRVKDAVGQALQLTDCAPGASDSLPADEAFLEPSWENFNACMRHVFGGQSATVQGMLAEKTSSVVSGPERLDRLRKAVAHLATLSFQMMPGVQFRIHTFLEQGKEVLFPAAQRAPRPVFVFDPTGSNTGHIKARGGHLWSIQREEFHANSASRVCRLPVSTQKGRVEEFLH